jgi:hypothetical protein
MQSDILAAVGSITVAMRAERVLLDAGISAAIVSLDPEQTRRGCAFAVSFPADKEAAARRELRAARIFVSQFIKG